MVVDLEVHNTYLRQLETIFNDFINAKVVLSTDIAKTDKLLLKTHTTDVLNQFTNLLSYRPTILNKLENNFNELDIKKLIYLSIIFHDIGKAFINWQTTCQKNTLQHSHIRHELVYIPFIKYYIEKTLKLPVLDTEIILTAIAAHHSKLSEYHQYRFTEADEKIKYHYDTKQSVKNMYENYDGIYDYFTKLSNKYRSKYRLTSLNRHLIKYTHLFNSIRSIVQFCDQTASALEAAAYVPKIVNYDYTFQYTTKRNVQQIVLENWNNDILILRARTGAGKTEAALLWANEQIKHKRADRLCIAMPTQFTSNTLAINVAKSVKNTNTQHSSAKFSYDSFTDYYFARKLESAATVSTIDHLINSFTFNKEEIRTRFVNIINSCVVIDEADFYDDYIIANLIVFLQICKIFNVPVLIMSATLPDKFIDLLKDTNYNNLEMIEDDTNWLQPKIRINSIVKNYNQDLSDITKILDVALTKSTIIYANTVDRAIEYYRYFKEKNIKNLVLYHSRFILSDKNEKEKRILKLLGKDSKIKHAIVIMTQIGEMSIDISAPYIITDLAPGDRLTQRFGRGERFSNLICDAVVIIPYRHNEIYPAPYGEFKRKWIPNKYWSRTKSLLRITTYSQKEFVDLINQIYVDLQLSTESIANSKHLYSFWKKNWILNPKFEIDESTQTTRWKCRDIEEQYEIYINHKTYFESKLEFEKFRLFNTVGIANYRAENLLQRGVIVKVNVKILEDEIDIFVLNEKEYYNLEIGLVFQNIGVENIL